MDAIQGSGETGVRVDLSKRMMLEASLIATTLFGISLVYNLVEYLRATERLAGSIPFDLSLSAAVLVLAFVAAQNWRCAAVALPISAAMMAAPQLPHLPFVREFGAIVLVGVALRIGWDERFLGHTSIRDAILALRGNRIIFAGAAFIGVSIFPLVQAGLSGDAATAKVIVSHIAFEILGWFLIALMTAAVLLHGEHVLELMLRGIFIASAATITFGFAALLFPFVSNGAIEHLSYYGAYFYCRLKATFYGPTDFSMFICLTIPVLTLFSVRASNPKIRWTALACLIAIPLLLVASSSRTARVSAVACFALLACRREFRVASLSLGAYTLVLMSASSGYRCTIDIVDAILGRPAVGIGGFVPWKEFFQDLHRQELALNFARFFEGPASAEWRDVCAHVIRLLFGGGAGISAYEVFGKGAHLAYADIVIDKGLVGAGLVVIVAVSIAARLALTWELRSAGGQRRLFVLATMLVPLALASAVVDTQFWLVSWLMCGLMVAEVELMSQSR